MDDTFLSVAEAASVLNVHRTRINQLIDTGKLPATRVGRSYVIREADLEAVRERPSPGRPSTKAEQTTMPKAGTKPATKKRAGKKGK